LQEKLQTQEKKFKEEAAKYKESAKKQAQMYVGKKAADAKGAERGEKAYLQDQLEMKQEDVRRACVYVWV